MKELISKHVLAEFAGAIKANVHAAIIEDLRGVGSNSKDFTAKLIASNQLAQANLSRAGCGLWHSMGRRML